MGTSLCQGRGRKCGATGVSRGGAAACRCVARGKRGSPAHVYCRQCCCCCAACQSSRCETEAAREEEPLETSEYGETWYG